MAKKDNISFDFGFNVKPKGAPKAKKSKQTANTRQAFALARKKGGPLHGVSGS
jgi:hypothetical protein